jgi:hypothetical protein
MSSEKFDQWAIVEIMGHQRLAGRVTEQAIGGSSFVRVDVPEVGGCPPFTKLLGSSSIYAITITDEETARAAANSLRQKPLDEWSARVMLEKLGENRAPQLPSSEPYEEYEEDDIPI